jgi:hypothetical protein
MILLFGSYQAWSSTPSQCMAAGLLANTLSQSPGETGNMGFCHAGPVYHVRGCCNARLLQLEAVALISGIIGQNAQAKAINHIAVDAQRNKQ